MSHFDLSGPRYAVAKAQNSNFGDGSRAVWPATRAKSVKMVKTFPPLEPKLKGCAVEILIFMQEVRSYGMV